MMIRSRADLVGFLAGKKVGLLVFNKDTRSLLRFCKDNIKSADFRIECLIDLTLDYRANVKTLATDMIDSNKLITTADDLKRLLDRNGIDFLLCFDRHIDTPEAVSSIADCYRVLHADYERYQGFATNAEYNFRYRSQVIDYITGYAARKGVYIASAYWENLYPFDSAGLAEELPSDEYFVTFSKQHAYNLVPSLENGFERAQVRFILGTDWGSGKTSLLFNRMKAGAGGIAFDFWFSMVGETFLPLLSMQDSYLVKGLIANEIYKAWSADPNKEIYIKLGGRIEEYVYGIPVDRRLSIDNMHRYFENARFVIVVKPGQTLDDIARVLSDLRSQYGIADNLEVRQMGYDGQEMARLL